MKTSVSILAAIRNLHLSLVNTEPLTEEKKELYSDTFISYMLEQQPPTASGLIYLTIERNRALENSSSHDQDSLTQSPSVPTYDKKKPKL